jgi:hypothetical protein
MIRKMLRLATLLVSRFRTRYNSVGEFDRNKYQFHNLYNFPAGHRHCICPVYMANMHHFPLNFGDILLGMTYKKLGRRLRKLGTFLGHRVYNLIHICQHHNFDMWHCQDPGRFFQCHSLCIPPLQQCLHNHLDNLHKHWHWLNFIILTL